MKKSILTALSIALMMMFIFTSCKKNVDQPGTGPGNPVDTTTIRQFKIAIDSLPGEQNVLQNLVAVISIVNEQGQQVVTDQQLNLAHSGKYSTASISLRKGNYKISKLLIYQNNAVKFVTPYFGSARAYLVNVPLSIPFFLANNEMKTINVQVARVHATDKSEYFGYPVGAFGDLSTEPADLKIRIQPLIRIGEVIYDSIPVTLTVITFNHAGQSTTQTLVLNAGTNEISLSGSAAKYQFKISKWGTYDDLTLLRNQVQPGTTYSLGGMKEAKKLKEELTYNLTGGIYKAETKIVYQYNGSGKIQEITEYRKRPDQTNYVASKEIFEYSGNRIERVKRFDETNSLTATKVFSYAQDGKLLQVFNVEGNDNTTANITYSSMPGGTGISGNHLISVKFQYSMYTYSTNLNLEISGGNIQHSTEVTSHGNSKTASFQYDYSINPFIHLGIPDSYFSNYSKHNKTADTRTFVNDFPLYIPYQFNYTYDADGYPVELVTKIKNYQTQQHAQTIKTVYKY